MKVIQGQVVLQGYWRTVWFHRGILKLIEKFADLGMKNGTNCMYNQISLVITSRCRQDTGGCILKDPRGMVDVNLCVVGGQAVADSCFILVRTTHA